MRNGPPTSTCASVNGCWCLGCDTVGSHSRRRLRSSASVGPRFSVLWWWFASGVWTDYGNGRSTSRLAKWPPIEDLIRQSFDKQPARTVAEAGERKLSAHGTAAWSQPSTQVPQRSRNEAVVRPCPSRADPNNLAEHVEIQAKLLDTELKPKLHEGLARKGHVCFVDAVHFVLGTYLCCLGSFTRIFVREASGRQRFNLLGAWNAVTRERITVTNTTVVNTATICELLRKIAALGLSGTDHDWTGQRPLSTRLRSAGHGEGVRNHIVVPALGLAKPERDRASVEVHQASCALRPLPSNAR